jgi:hypothetical protein
MATDEDDLISDGKLFHKNTILMVSPNFFVYKFNSTDLLINLGLSGSTLPLMSKIIWC